MSKTKSNLSLNNTGQLLPRIAICGIIIVLSSALLIDYDYKNLLYLNIVSLSLLLLLSAYALSKATKLPKTLIFLSAFTLWAILSSIWSNNLNALSVSGPYFIGIILAWSTYFYVKTPSEHKITLYSLWLITLGVAIMSNLTSHFDRLYFGFILPNQVSTIMSLGLILSLYLSFKAKSLIHKIIYSSSCALFLYSLIKTSSRGGLIALCIALALTLALKHKHSFKCLISNKLLIFGFAIVTVLALMSPQAKLLNRNVRDNAHDRSVYASTSLEMFKNSPLIGAGIGSYQTTGLSMQHNVQALTRNAHASGLQLLAELGLIGLCLLLTSLFYLYKESKNNHTTYSKVYWLLLTVFILQASVDIHLEYPSMIYLSYLLVGLIGTDSKSPHR